MKRIKELQLIIKMNERLGVATDQAVYDEIASEELKEQRILDLQEERKRAFKSTFSDLSKEINKLVAEEKQKTEEEQALLDRFANVLTKIDEIRDASTSNPQVTIAEDSVEGQQEDVLEVVAEAAAILAPIEQPSLAKEAAKKIAKDAPPSMFVQPDPAVTSRDLKDIQQKLKLMEGWVSKISMAGPGGGAVWLRDLDDINRPSIMNAANGQVMMYNSNNKKWQAGMPTLDQVTTSGNITNNGIITGNITPFTTLTYSLGNTTNRWESLWVGANSITFSDTLGGPDQILSLANQVFYITQGSGSNATFNANAGFNAGGLIMQNYSLVLANAQHDMTIGSPGDGGKIIIQRSLEVGQSVANSAQSAFQVDTTGLTVIRNNLQIINPVTQTDVAPLTIQAQLGVPPTDLKAPGTTIYSINSANLSNRVVMDTYGNNNFNVIFGRTARGDITTPTQMVANDVMLCVCGIGYDGNDFTQFGSGRIDITATESFTPTNKGTKIDLWTTPIGSNVVSISTSFDNNGIHLGNHGNTADLHISGGANGQVLIADGANNLHWAYPTLFVSAWSNTTITANTINTAYPIHFNNVDGSLGISVGTGANTSHVIVSRTGRYNFQFSAQLHQTQAAVNYVYIWSRINGVDVPDSGSKIALSGSTAETVVAWNYILPMSANSYFELMWSTSSTSCVLLSDGAGAGYPGPAIPSVILTATSVI